MRGLSLGKAIRDLPQSCERRATQEWSQLLRTLIYLDDALSILTRSECATPCSQP